MNKVYYLHDADGQIVQYGSCHADDLELQRRDGLTLREGVADCLKHYQDGNELKEIPTRPSAFHSFDYKLKKWVANEERATAGALAERAKRLAATDWTQLPDVPQATSAKWLPYRQALRDITTQVGYPFQIVWPEAPA